MAALVVEGDKYRSLLHAEEEKNTKWRFGTLPSYTTVNKLFEEGRTKVSSIVFLVEFYIYLLILHFVKTFTYKYLSLNEA